MEGREQYAIPSHCLIHSLISLSLSLSPLPEHIHVCQAAPKVVNARCKAEVCSVQVGEDLNGYLWGQLGQIGETLPFLGTRGDVPVVTGMAGGDLSHYNKKSVIIVSLSRVG